jgi:hypothetical protein
MAPNRESPFIAHLTMDLLNKALEYQKPTFDKRRTGGMDGVACVFGIANLWAAHRFPFGGLYALMTPGDPCTYDR